MSIIQARISGEEEQLVINYAKVNNISISDLIRSSVLEKIEDEIDLKAYEQAMQEFAKNPKTYTLDEVEKELGLR